MLILNVSLLLNGPQKNFRQSDLRRYSGFLVHANEFKLKWILWYKVEKGGSSVKF